MGVLDLTPKRILLDAIKGKLEGTDINKMTLIFCLDTDKYNVMLSTRTGKSLKLDLDEKEITTIKKLFIRRIVSKWNERYDKEPKDVIIQVDLDLDDLSIFINTKKEEVLKFEP